MALAQQEAQDEGATFDRVGIELAMDIAIVELSAAEPAAVIALLVEVLAGDRLART